MFEFDRPLEGQGHLTNKVKCPQCQYEHFSVKIRTDMSGFLAECRNCTYTTAGIGGLQGMLEEKLRAVIKVDIERRLVTNNQKNKD